MAGKKFILGLIFTMILLSGCAQQPPVLNPLEKACIDSGGTVIKQSCCASASDFPNSCLIGACGCSPDNSKEVNFCDCGAGRCFDGSSCVVSEAEPSQVTSFEECVAAGYPVMESYPLQCMTPDGETFMQEITDPMAQMCALAGGNWNECSSKCFIDNQGKEGVACTMMCEALCECAGPESYKCPEGFTCKKPEGITDALGYCEQQTIGGERDEHGCLGPAGYSWDQDIGACIRGWELNETQKSAVKIVAAPLSYPVTVTEVIAGSCSGCFIVKLQRNDNQEQFERELENWTIK